MDTEIAEYTYPLRDIVYDVYPALHFKGNVPAWIRESVEVSVGTMTNARYPLSESHAVRRHADLIVRRLGELPIGEDKDPLTCSAWMIASDHPATIALGDHGKRYLLDAALDYEILRKEAQRRSFLRGQVHFPDGSGTSEDSYTQEINRLSEIQNRLRAKPAPTPHVMKK